MYFMLRDGWSIQFLESDLKTPLPRKLQFRDAAKVREMYDRFAEDKSLADRASLEHGIEMGRGGIFLRLTSEQYQKLKSKQ